MLTNPAEMIQPAQIDYKQAIFQKNNALLQQKRLEHKKKISMAIKLLESDELNQPVVQIIKSIQDNEDQRNMKENLREEASKRILVIGKQALEDAKLVINHQNRSYYEGIVEDNVTLAQISLFKEKKWFKLFKSYESVVNIDLLAYFLHCNDEYSEKCYLQITVWSLVQLGQLFNISPQVLRYLKRYYNNYHSMFSIDKQSKLSILITVLTLARYKIKIINMNGRSMQEILYIYQSKTWKIDKYGEEDKKKICSLPIERFSFSEIAIFAKEKFVVSYPRLQMPTISSCIRRIHDSQLEQNRKRIIKYVMMQFHMPIKVIEDFLRNIKNNVEYRNNAYFQQDLKKDLSCLERNTKYMFACNLIPAKAIQKLKLQQEYNTKLDSTFTFSQCRTDVLACLARAALAVVKQYFFCSALQLQSEAMHQPFLAITKFYFSYQSIKEPKRSPEKSDTITTIILGTQGKNIVFHHLYPQRLADKGYLKQLKAIIKQHKRTIPQSIVLFERQLDNHLRWQLFKNLVKFIVRFSRLRIYASIQPAYYQLNRYLYSCILTYMKFFAPIMSKQLFYPLCEKITEKVIRLFKRTLN